jgi:hypothetical protein
VSCFHGHLNKYPLGDLNKCPLGDLNKCPLGDLNNSPWENYLEGGGSKEIIKSTRFCKVHYVLNSDIKSLNQGLLTSGWWGGGGVHPLYSRLLDRYLETTNGCSSISDICFMPLLQGEGETEWVVSKIKKTDFIQFAVVPLKL